MNMDIDFYDEPDVLVILERYCPNCSSHNNDVHHKLILTHIGGTQAFMNSFHNDDQNNIIPNIWKFDEPMMIDYPDADSWIEEWREWKIKMHGEGVGAFSFKCSVCQTKYYVEKNVHGDWNI